MLYFSLTNVNKPLFALYLTPYRYSQTASKASGQACHIQMSTCHKDDSQLVDITGKTMT